MKNLVKGIICLSVFFISVAAKAQTPPVREPDMNRPTLFQNSPSRINCRVNELAGLLQKSTGAEVSIIISENLVFQGVVSSTAKMYDNKLQSVVIRSTNLPGAALSFSKIINEDGGVSFAGRIISFQHGDAYEITLENDQYVFVKKGFYDLVNE